MSKSPSFGHFKRMDFLENVNSLWGHFSRGGGSNMAWGFGVPAFRGSVAGWGWLQNYNSNRHIWCNIFVVLAVSRSCVPLWIRSHPGKPKQRKVSSWTFRRGIPEQKFNLWIVLVFPRKNTRIHKKMGEIHMNFSFWPSLWFGLPGRLLKLEERC